MRPLKKTKIIIQLANHSLVRPKSVLDDVLVQVNELVYLVDFYVFDIGDNDS